MLVWDSFRAHLSKPVRSTLRSINTECVVIPGGMTSMLQPLDVSINKPFKDRMRAKWQNWMLAGQHSFTAGGRIRKVELDEICRWISDTSEISVSPGDWRKSPDSRPGRASYSDHKKVNK